MIEMAAPVLAYTAVRRHDPTQRFVEVDVIKKVVTDHFHISMKTLKRKCRKQELVYCRQVLMYFLSKFTQLSLQSIGNMFDGKDHTTVIHSRETIKDLVDSDDKVYYEIEEITAKLFKMDIKITSETDLVDVATRSIHILNNLIAATDRYNTLPGIDARRSKRRWEDQARVFLSEVSGKYVKHKEQALSVVLTTEG